MLSLLLLAFFKQGSMNSKCFKSISARSPGHWPSQAGAESRRAGRWHVHFNLGMAVRLHRRPGGSQTRCTALLSCGFHFKGKWGSSQCVPSSFSHDRVYDLNGGYFFIQEAASERCHNKRCYKRRQRQSSVLQCVLVWRQAASVGRGEGLTSEEQKNHSTLFLSKAYGVANMDTLTLGYCPL